MLAEAVPIAITTMIVGVDITRCGPVIPAADDFRVLGEISLAIMVVVLVTFLYITHIFDLNPRYSERRYLYR